MADTLSPAPVPATDTADLDTTTSASSVDPGATLDAGAAAVATTTDTTPVVDTTQSVTTVTADTTPPASPNDPVSAPAPDIADTASTAAAAPTAPEPVSSASTLPGDPTGGDVGQSAPGAVDSTTDTVTGVTQSVSGSPSGGDAVADPAAALPSPDPAPAAPTPAPDPVATVSTLAGNPAAGDVGQSAAGAVGSTTDTVTGVTQTVTNGGDGVTDPTSVVPSSDLTSLSAPAVPDPIANVSALGGDVTSTVNGATDTVAGLPQTLTPNVADAVGDVTTLIPSTDLTPLPTTPTVPDLLSNPIPTLSDGGVTGNPTPPDLVSTITTQPGDVTGTVSDTSLPSTAAAVLPSSDLPSLSAPAVPDPIANVSALGGDVTSTVNGATDTVAGLPQTLTPNVADAVGDVTTLIPSTDLTPLPTTPTVPDLLSNPIPTQPGDVADAVSGTTDAVVGVTQTVDGVVAGTAPTILSPTDVFEVPPTQLPSVLPVADTTQLLAPPQIVSDTGSVAAPGVVRVELDVVAPSGGVAGSHDVASSPATTVTPMHTDTAAAAIAPPTPPPDHDLANVNQSIPGSSEGAGTDHSAVATGPLNDMLSAAQSAVTVVNSHAIYAIGVVTAAAIVAGIARLAASAGSLATCQGVPLRLAMATVWDASRTFPGATSFARVDALTATPRGVVPRGPWFEVKSAFFGPGRFDDVTRGLASPGGAWARRVALMMLATAGALIALASVPARTIRRVGHIYASDVAISSARIYLVGFAFAVLVGLVVHMVGS